MKHKKVKSYKRRNLVRHIGGFFDGLDVWVPINMPHTIHLGLPPKELSEGIYESDPDNLVYQIYHLTLLDGEEVYMEEEMYFNRLEGEVV